MRLASPTEDEERFLLKGQFEFHPINPTFGVSEEKIKKKC